MTSQDAEPKIIRSAVKLAIGVGALLLVQLVVTNLAMLQQTVPIPNVYLTYATIGKAVIQTAIFILLLRFGSEIRPAAEAYFPTAPEIGRILQFAIWLVPVAIGYAAYSDLASAVLGTGIWVYQLVFILLAAGLLIAMSAFVFRNLDAVSDLVVHQFRKPQPSQRTVLARCPSCGGAIESGAQFCTICGKPTVAITEPAKQEAPASALSCPKCEMAVLATQRFCRGCGTALQAN